ncbi:N-formylglutamate amidohydrolase [Brevundimonas sp. Root1423]|uniref:N-formylglutamate amidohydrolase n=1 Tax=Brevundimonas sp. Root1423 TaxID=1736462 RepID=UPI0006F64923|nr:N-formylglutamate amidohydrolase [Brevundimonas sp. Root1423]KQY89761.1 N-formylglutamate amidohydrolase [Brevundimonas sp. Root1423]
MTLGGDSRDQASFTVVEATAAGRFVFASPHSGDLYPADMGADPDLSQASLRSAEDALVDQLIAPGTDSGAVLVLGRLGRAYVDLNRDPADLDPLLIEGLGDSPGSARTAAGYGVIPRLGGDGKTLYRRRLTLEEARERIARVHAPYHAAIGERMRAARARHGGAVLVDWHSMPARATQGSGGARGPDVVLGDRHGASCEAELTRRLRRAFEALGWRVALNQPYAGGWTTQSWGRPEEGFQAIQIELNRALYFDEAARTPSAGWSRTQKGVARVIAGLLAGEA